jgi:hypothetical protein
MRHMFRGGLLLRGGASASPLPFAKCSDEAVSADMIGGDNDDGAVKASTEHNKASRATALQFIIDGLSSMARLFDGSVSQVSMSRKNNAILEVRISHGTLDPHQIGKMHYEHKMVSQCRPAGAPQIGNPH